MTLGIFITCVILILVLIIMGAIATNNSKINGDGAKETALFVFFVAALILGMILQAVYNT